MTSTVKIDAHLSDDKEVRVVVASNDKLVEEFTIQNGQSATRHIHDDLVIIVKEMVKEKPKE
jgi:hypothetical protein